MENFKILSQLTRTVRLLNRKHHQTHLRFVQGWVGRPLVQVFINLAIVASKNTAQELVRKVKCINKGDSVRSDQGQQLQDSVMNDVQLTNAHIAILHKHTQRLQLSQNSLKSFIVVHQPQRTITSDRVKFHVVLRSSDTSLLHKPTTKTHFADRAFCCTAPTVWNLLSNDGDSEFDRAKSIFIQQFSTVFMSN